MANQKELILDYMREFGSITPMDAFYDLGITKLATRISELRALGMKIKIKMVNAKNRYGKKITFCQYSLEDDNDGKLQ